MFLNIHYDPYHCTVGHRYTVVLLLLLSKIQFFFPPALLDSKAKMLTIFFCSWPWSCDSSSRPVTDWMRLLKVDTMMDWMFHVKLSSIFLSSHNIRLVVKMWWIEKPCSVLQSFSTLSPECQAPATGIMTGRRLELEAGHDGHSAHIAKSWRTNENASI